VHVPEISVTPPRLHYWQWILLRLSPVAAAPVVGVIAGVTGHNSGMTSGALIAAGAIVLIAGIEIPLIMGAQARGRRRTMESAPTDVLLAAHGSQVGYLAGAISGPSEARTGFRSGLINIDRAGVRFRASRENARVWDTNLRWEQIERVDVRSDKSPATARLRVVTTDGQTVWWRLPSFQDLCAALDQLQLGQTGTAGPSKLSGGYAN
jgi:hypothetical protein